MPQRGYALVFFLWALLAIITPTLVFWSASARPGLGSQGEASEMIMARRMMGLLERNQLGRAKEEAPILAPAPSPLPMPSSIQMVTTSWGSVDR